MAHINPTWLATLALLLPASTALACPTRLPDGLAAVPVAAKVATNGLSMSINQVESRDSVDELLRRTEKLWADGGYAVKRSQAAGWEVLSAMGDQCLVTLQLISRNGSFGYFTLGRRGGAGAITPRSMGVPIPGDATVTSSVVSEDDGRKGLVIAMNSSRSPQELGNYFMEQLAENHWAATRAHTIKNNRTGVHSMFVRAQRNRQQIEIVIWSERATQVVMTVSEAL